MSWGLASACLVAVLLPGVPVYVANLRVQQEAVQVARQKALINEQLSASGARVRVDIVTTRLDGDKGERGVTGGALAFVVSPGTIGLASSRHRRFGPSTRKTLPNTSS